MKTPSEFVKTIYLGDRACKRVIIDGWRKRLALEVDTISRNRNPSGKWQFYTGEDIVDGLIVFEGVRAFEIAPPGLLPSDWIEFLNIEETVSNFRATLSLGAVDEKGNAKELTLTVDAMSLHIEDPKQPGVKITE